METPGSKTPNDWSPDAKLLLYRDTNVRTGFDLMVVSSSATAPPAGRARRAARGLPDEVATAAAGEMNGQFSPDGAWIAYESDESGEWVDVRATAVRGARRNHLDFHPGRPLRTVAARWHRAYWLRLRRLVDGIPSPVVRRTHSRRRPGKFFAVALRPRWAAAPVPGVGRRPALPGQCRDRRRSRGAHADPQLAPRR